MIRYSLAVAAITLGACATTGSQAQIHRVEGDCTLSAGDQAWLDSAMRAWNYASEKITGLGRTNGLHAVFFDDNCVVSSATAMNGGPNTWSATSHDGEVTIPSGDKIPAGVISFAKGGEDKGYFVMSTPSVWAAANIPHNGLGSLETLMIAVVLHEGSHVAQVPTYGKWIGAIAEKNKLPEDWNDDSIQERFKNRGDFTASIWREVDAFLAAAQAPDRATSLKLAREAREMMKARQARWYVGQDSYQAEAEDLWLSMEGSAQWAAYQWVVDPSGGGVAEPVAFHSFGRRRGWWSQDEGFALFMALDRLTNGSWKRHAFGDGAKTALQMLDEAIA